MTMWAYLSRDVNSLDEVPYATGNQGVVVAEATADSFLKQKGRKTDFAAYVLRGHILEMIGSTIFGRVLRVDRQDARVRQHAPRFLVKGVPCGRREHVENVIEKTYVARCIGVGPTPFRLSYGP